MDSSLIEEVISLISRSTSNAGPHDPPTRALWKAERDEIVMRLHRELAMRGHVKATSMPLESIGVESFDSLLTLPPHEE